MPDYTELLSRISSSLETIATSPNYSKYFWISPLAILVTGIIAVWAAAYTVRSPKKQESIRSKEKKALVFSLLKDEINLRWKADIEPYIRALLKLDPLSGLQGFSRMILRSEDLFVLKQISTSFADYYFLENSALVSRITHGYLLYSDLIDLHATVSRFIADQTRRREEPKSGEPELEVTEAYRGKLDELWQRFEEKLNEVDTRLQSILPDIEQSQSSGQSIIRRLI